MSAAGLLAQAAEALAASRAGTPRLDAEILTAHVLGLDRVELIAGRAIEVPSGSAATLAHLLRRRCAGEPVARIIGRKEFWSLPFALSESVLVPRPETELLVEAAIQRVRAGDLPAKCRILDLGTGSGCVLLALLHELPDAVGVGVDIDAEAVATAEANARRLGLEGRAEFRVADWRNAETFDMGPGRFDLVVSNPPYVRSAEIASLAPEVSAFDPRIALDGGDDGLAAYRRIFGRLAELCPPNAHAFFECGAGQWRAVVSIAKSHDWRLIETRKDLAGIERVIEFCAPASLR